MSASASRFDALQRHARVFAALGALLVVPAVFVAGCGESKEEKAEKTICSARAEINKEIEHLRTLTPSSSAITEARNGLTNIGHSLTKIGESAKELSPSRKQEVIKASEDFAKKVGETITNVAKGVTSPAQAQAAITTALGGLSTDYQQALAPIKCPSS
jgi:hypothetical protein